MVLCCLIPLAAIGAILLLDIPLNTVLFVGLLVLCPLLHLGMMGGMMRHSHKRRPAEPHGAVNVAESEQAVTESG